MIDRRIFILSLVVALGSGQTSNSEKNEISGRSREPQAEGRFFPPFGGFGGGFRPGGLFGGGYPRPGGFPGFFGGYYPGAYRPGGYFQGGYPGGYYGGYPQYPRPQRPGFGNRPYGGGGGGLGGAAPVVPSVSRPGLDNSNSNNRPMNTLPNLSNLTPSQAALLGQALGASLRPLLMANGGAGLGGAGSANPLADILAQLG